MVQGTKLFASLAEKHPAVEVWADEEFTDGGWSYFWIVSRFGEGSVRNLAYVRLRGNETQKRTYDASGDSCGLPLNSQIGRLPCSDSQSAILLWLMVMVGLGCGWWLDRRNERELTMELRENLLRAQCGSKQLDSPCLPRVTAGARTVLLPGNSTVVSPQPPSASQQNVDTQDKIAHPMGHDAVPKITFPIQQSVEQHAVTGGRQPFGVS